MNEDDTIKLCQIVVAGICKKIGYEATGKIALIALGDLFRLCKNPIYETSSKWSSRHRTWILCRY
jgi:hypothetical protein